ncbi:hypothetical protein EV714DRAFT_278114 [Schizophyllum commune]
MDSKKYAKLLEVAKLVVNEPDPSEQKALARDMKEELLEFISAMEGNRKDPVMKITILRVLRQIEERGSEGALPPSSDDDTDDAGDAAEKADTSDKADAAEEVVPPGMVKVYTEPCEKCLQGGLMCTVKEGGRVNTACGPCSARRSNCTHAHHGKGTVTAKVIPAKVAEDEVKMRKVAQSPAKKTCSRSETITADVAGAHGRDAMAAALEDGFGRLVREVAGLTQEVRTLRGVLERTHGEPAIGTWESFAGSSMSSQVPRSESGEPARKRSRVEDDDASGPPEPQTGEEENVEGDVDMGNAGE